MSVKRLPRFLLSAMLVLAGMLVAGSEARALWSNGNADTALPDRLRSGLSADMKMAALMRCDDAMAEPAFGMMGAVLRRRTAKICADLAIEVRADTPTHGFAHFIAAKAAHALDQPESLAGHLTASQILARNEGWLAERRFLLLRQSDTRLQEHLLPVEIETMLTTQTGAAILADALGDPVLRDLILQVATRAPAQLRQRLVNLARRKAAQG